MHNLSKSVRNVQSHSTEDFITLLKDLNPHLKEVSSSKNLIFVKDLSSFKLVHLTLPYGAKFAEDSYESSNMGFVTISYNSKLYTIHVI